MKFLPLSLAITAATASTIASDCSSSQKDAVTAASQKCAKMANAAAKAAESDSDSSVFESFFKSSDESTRNRVAANYRKVAEECSSTPSGGTGTSSCTDQYHNCQGDLLGYTYWSNSGAGGQQHSGKTYYCPRYFESSILAAESSRCDEQSQGSNTLHETTHAVLATEDIAYGLSGSKSLSSQQALQNADTYTFYAIAIDLGCGGSSSSTGDSSGGANPSNNGWGLGGISSNGGGSSGSAPSNNGWGSSNGFRGFTWWA